MCPGLPEKTGFSQRHELELLQGLAGLDTSPAWPEELPMMMITGTRRRSGVAIANATGERIMFSDFSYTEMLLELEPDPRAITIDSDPYVIIRPEGEWDRPGVLDRSAARAAASPHHDPVCTAD